MNVENIQKLINHLQKTKEENFDMKFWLMRYPYQRSAKNILEQMETTGGCGTVACLAGHAALIRAAEEGESLRDQHISSFAADWLDLDDHQTGSLFLSGFWANKDQAIQTLFRLMETGEVVWEC